MDFVKYLAFWLLLILGFSALSLIAPFAAEFIEENDKLAAIAAVTGLALIWGSILFLFIRKVFEQRKKILHLAALPTNFLFKTFNRLELVFLASICIASLASYRALELNGINWLILILSSSAFVVIGFYFGALWAIKKIHTKAYGDEQEIKTKNVLDELI